MRKIGVFTFDKKDSFGKEVEHNCEPSNGDYHSSLDVSHTNRYFEVCRMKTISDYKVV